MRELESLDTIITIRECLLSEVDYRYLDELYVPIIGINALSLYRALYGYEKKSSHEDFLGEKKLTKGDFLLSLEPLEALGLVRTFLTKNGEKRTYTYYLFSPLSPRDFFDSPIHKALLEKEIGKTASQTLYARYAYPAIPKEGEISTSFREYFLSTLANLTYEQGPTKRNSGRAKIKFEFEKSRFIEEIRALDDRFTEKSFSSEEYKYISSLSTMYNYTEDVLASFVVDCFDFSRPLGKRLGKEFLEDVCRKNVNLSYLKKEEPEEVKISGTSASQRMLRRMQEEAPAAFLKGMQGNHKPAEADLRIVRHLATETGMSSSAINALVFYILVTKGDNLNLNYCEKVGADIVRKGLTNAIDVTDYLENYSKRRKKKEEVVDTSFASALKKEEYESRKPVQKIIPSSDDEDDETDYDALFKQLKEREGR